MTEYQKQLKDPRWQKRRLEIMERDEWTCQSCGDTEGTLTVHHKSYKFNGNKFADLWDYDGEDLITLCEKCHSEEEESLKKFKDKFYFMARERAENSDSLWELFYLIDTIYCGEQQRVIDPRIGMLTTLVSTVLNKTDIGISEALPKLINHINDGGLK